MKPAGEHIFRDETFVPRPRHETFAFFADAENLERITPPQLRFAIKSPVPIAMTAGTRIDYQLRIARLRYRTRAQGASSSLNDRSLATNVSEGCEPTRARM